MTKDSINDKGTYFNPHDLRWGDETNSSAMVLAIHGYNDYSKSFEIPANFLTKFNPNELPASHWDFLIEFMPALKISA